VDPTYWLHQFAVSGTNAIDARWLLPVTGAVDLGPAAVWDARMNLLDDWDDAHGYWLGAQWVGPAARWTRDLGAHHLEVAMGAGLVGAVGRPPEPPRLEKQDPLQQPLFWLVGPARGERFTTIATTQAVRLDAMLALPRPEGRDGGWVLGVDTRLVRTTLPAIAVDLGTTAWIGRSWGTR
jgi:hypothetical protein